MHFLPAPADCLSIADRLVYCSTAEGATFAAIVTAAAAAASTRCDPDAVQGFRV